MARNGTEWHGTISQNLLGINYRTEHSLVHLIRCLEHPSYYIYVVHLCIAILHNYFCK